MGELPCRFPQHFVYLHLLAKDEKTQNMIDFWPTSNSFIDEAKAVGGRVLVHSGNGRSRAGSTAVAYLMHHSDLDFSEALIKAKTYGRSILPNVSFCEQLREFRRLNCSISNTNRRYGPAGKIVRLSLKEEAAGRQRTTQRHSVVTERDDSPGKENYASIHTRQHVDVVLGLVPEQPGDRGAPVREDLGDQVSEERRQQHQLREELAQARAEVEALRAKHSRQCDEELRQELRHVRAELEEAKGELRLAKQQNGVARTSQWSDTSTLDTTHPSIGLKLSLTAADGEPPVASRGLSQSELNSLSEPSPDGPDETLTCGLLPTGHPLRVCVKQLKMAPEKENCLTMLHPGAPNSWGVPELALPPGSGQQQVRSGHSTIFRQLPSETSFPQRRAYVPVEEAGKLASNERGGDILMQPNGVSDAVARLKSMTAELRAPVVISH